MFILSLKNCGTIGSLLCAAWDVPVVLILLYLSFVSPDEALQRQEEIWQQEVEESLSFCRSLSHPSRPKHVDFLRITAPEDDITDTPPATPVPEEFTVSSMTSWDLKTEAILSSLYLPAGMTHANNEKNTTSNSREFCQYCFVFILGGYQKPVVKLL